jgi:hypothetical protein
MTIRATIAAIISALSISIAAPASSQGLSRVGCPAEYSTVDSSCLKEIARDLIKVFRPIEAISYVLGSKRVVGYFTTVNGDCRVTLMLVEEVDPMESDPRSAARLILLMHPGQSASIGSEEAEAMLVTCKGAADSLEVQRSSPHDRASASRQYSD